MQPGVRHLPRIMVALVAITVAGLAGATDYLKNFRQQGPPDGRRPGHRQAVGCKNKGNVTYNFTNVNYPGTAATQAFGLNNSGLVAGTGYYNDGTGIGWIYDSNRRRFTALPPLSPCFDQAALGINDSGVIAGDCQVDAADSLDFGFILDKKGDYTYLNYPGFEHTYPRGISKTGVVTGYAIDNWDDYNWIAFIYDPKSETFTQIAFPVPDPTLTAWEPLAHGITANGRVVGSVILANADFSYEDYWGFVREPNGAITYFQVNGTHTLARGINDAGVISGFTYTPDWSVREGFVGTLPRLGGFRTMPNAEVLVAPFSGATETLSTAIDNSGDLVGIWIDGSGNLYGYIATPVPRGKK